MLVHMTHSRSCHTVRCGLDVSNIGTNLRSVMAAGYLHNDGIQCRAVQHTLTHPYMRYQTGGSHPNTLLHQRRASSPGAPPREPQPYMRHVTPRIELKLYSAR